MALISSKMYDMYDYFFRFGRRAAICLDCVPLVGEEGGVGAGEGAGADEGEA